MMATHDHATRASRARLRRLARWLDSSIRLPGGFTVGFDGIIGLIPGIGDLIAGGLSTYIIAEGIRFGVPAIVLVRMAGNVILEMLIGVIPVLGDVFDFVFKANERNVRLIDDYLDEPARMRVRSRWLVGIMIAGTVLAFALFIALVVTLVGLLWSAVTA